MQCGYCGKDDNQKRCASSAATSGLVYAPFFATAGGLAGSLIGFTLSGPLAALVGGFIGIVACDLAARCLLRPRNANPDSKSETSPTV